MTSAQSGSFPLIRIFGIRISLHWAWLAVALYQISQRKDEYSSLGWNAAEYLALFGIVLLHELGHALACRSVGGFASDILLWPLGGVAYVAPPPRPGAVLWSIAAGPLVNVVLLVPFTALLFFSEARALALTNPDLGKFISNLSFINGMLLVFNLLPVYPLDGGQILRALLWFMIGPARSLYTVVVIGFLGVAGLAVLAFALRDWWLGIIAGFVFIQCRRGWQQARAISASLRPPESP